MSRIRSLSSETISVLRFPLTVGIVFYHYNLAKSGLIVDGVTYGLSHPDWYDCVIRFFSEAALDVGMPLFFFFSGFLFFYRKTFTKELYIHQLRTRAKSLLIPFFLWNLIAILLPLFLSSLSSSANKLEIHVSLERLFHTFFANFQNEGILVSPVNSHSSEVSRNPYPIDVPLWYVRDLMVMALFSPVIFLLIRKFRICFPVTLGLIWYFYIPLLAPNGGWSTQLMIAAFFFSWGAYYSINKFCFVERFRKHWYVLFFYIPIAIADTLSNTMDYHLFIHDLTILIGLISFVVVASYLFEIGWGKVPDTFVNSCFFVYALHTLIIYHIGRVAFRLLQLSDTPSAMLFLYIMTPILTTVICVAIYMLFKRYAPSLCNMLSGWR